ncbi:MAG: DUF2130 domain-containing protein [Myxococcales bacterium]|nr:DUF2130 domain-containing protein [Myxococcales bacterium]
MPNITCPNCQHAFELTDAVRSELEKQVRGEHAARLADERKAREAEFAAREAVLVKQAADAQAALEAKFAKAKAEGAAALEAAVATRLKDEYEVKLGLLTQTSADSAAKLKAAQARELEFLKKVEALTSKEAELELQLQRTLSEERAKLAEKIRQEEGEKAKLKESEWDLRLKEMASKLEQQKALADEMQRKAEQGLTQRQGEVMEVALEELLRATFVHDEIAEVGKGVRGADCVQTVRNRQGQPCGTIIFESKRTAAFAGDWIEKLKTDMRACGADVAVLVTQTLPKGVERFGEKEGVWVCTFAEVGALTHVLREGLLRVAAVQKSQENRGHKTLMLYEYLTGNEFAEQWKAIREAFAAMQGSIQKERDAMEKLWKAREKQLAKALINMAGIKGSIEGISGQDVGLELLDEAAPAELPELV